MVFFNACFHALFLLQKKNINHKNISLYLMTFFSKLQINFSYKIICMQTDIETIRSRLKKNKRTFQLSFLENNEEKSKYLYKFKISFKIYISQK